MKTIRNLALAGTVAIAAALSSGAANAAPVAALEIGIPAASESAITPVFHYGYHYGPGFGYGSRLCYVPFFRLVQMFGYWRARMIKRRCFGGFGPYGGYYGY